jgi:hypothetical protein
MAGNQPTVADLQLLIQQLKGRVLALQAAQHAAPNVVAAAPVAPVVTFAVTPQALNAEDLIDYSTKQGSAIFDQGCKALDDKALADGFAMTPDQTVIFVEAFYRRAVAMGWTQGSKQITNFTNSAGVTVDIIKCYDQISKATLKTACECFCKVGEINAKSRATQNNAMMATCLARSLTADAQARLLTYHKEYTFKGVKYAPLMYKVIMHLATIDTVTTTQTLRDSLQNLGVFLVTVNGNINKIHGKFNKNFSHFISRGATVNDPIGILFDTYSVVPCYNFKQYIKCQHEDYLDGKLTSITHENLMTSAMRKYDYLKVKCQWGTKLPDDKKIVAMSAAISALKGHLKLDDKLSKLVDKKKEGGKMKKNKKNTVNKVGQNKDEAWKKVPPKDGEKHTMEVGKYTYHWCVHHMSWTVHPPTKCHLGKQHKEEQKTKPATTVHVNAATYATATATQINPHYQDMLAALADEDNE